MAERLQRAAHRKLEADAKREDDLWYTAKDATGQRWIGCALATHTWTVSEDARGRPVFGDRTRVRPPKKAKKADGSALANKRQRT